MGQATVCRITVALFLILNSPLVAQTGVTNGQWHHYGGDQGATRRCSLNQIDATNAGDLEVAWCWQTRNYGPRTEYSYVPTPPTQPFPTKPAPFGCQGFSEDELLDFTPEIFNEALKIAKRYRWGSLFSSG